MNYRWISFLLLFLTSPGYAEDCRDLEEVAYSVGELKDQGYNEEKLRSDVLSANSMPAELKVIFMQHIDMAYSSEHLEKSAEEYTAYIRSLCEQPLDDTWLNDMEKELDEIELDNRAPLVKRGWYIFYVGKSHIEFLHPDTFRTFANTVSYSHMSYEYSGEYKGERLDMKYEVDCSRFVSREASSTSITSWETGKFIEELEQKEGWKSPKPRSVLEKRSEIACEYYADGEERLMTVLEDLHVENYLRTVDMGIQLY